VIACATVVITDPRPAFPPHDTSSPKEISSVLVTLLVFLDSSLGSSSFFSRGNDASSPFPRLQLIGVVYYAPRLTEAFERSVRPFERGIVPS